MMMACALHPSHPFASPAQPVALVLQGVTPVSKPDFIPVQTTPSLAAKAAAAAKSGASSATVSLFGMLLATLALLL
jgi:hypothetical protein